MSDQDILAVLVKERERCRQLAQLYQAMRTQAGSSAPDRETLRTASRILTEVVKHLRELPRKPASELSTEPAREEARRLLREIGDLLERVMIAERETRERPPAPPAGPAVNHALRMYART